MGASATPVHDIDAITARWATLPWPPDSDAAKRQAVLADLISAYRSPGRHYHTLAHVAALLDLSATHAGDIHRPDIVDLAIFFHDAIYDVTRRDNEEASARLARERLRALGFAADAAAEVGRFIVASKHATAGTSAPEADLGWFLDFDLSVLAADRDAYARYSAAIRREYAVYPDAIYNPGRRGVLLAFLSRPRIYRTAVLFERWEALARNNIAWELARLAGEDK